MPRFGKYLLCATRRITGYPNQITQHEAAKLNGLEMSTVHRYYCEPAKRFLLGSACVHEASPVTLGPPGGPWTRAGHRQRPLAQVLPPAVFRVRIFGNGIGKHGS